MSASTLGVSVSGRERNNDQRACDRAEVQHDAMTRLARAFARYPTYALRSRYEYGSLRGQCGCLRQAGSGRFLRIELRPADRATDACCRAPRAMPLMEVQMRRRVASMRGGGPSGGFVGGGPRRDPWSKFRQAQQSAHGAAASQNQLRHRLSSSYRLPRPSRLARTRGVLCGSAPFR